MRTRGVALKVLAPTLLVSLVLVSACLFGTLYLNHLHVNASDVLSENVMSSQVAARLETTTKELLRLLRSQADNSPTFALQVHEQNRVARELLGEAEGLANLEHESVLVRQIADGLKEYLRRWDHRHEVGPDQFRAYDDSLANVLERDVLAPCIALRTYNSDQVEEADRDNRTIVNRLIWGLLAVGVGAPVSGLLLGYAMARRLHHSIYQLSVRIRDAAGRLNSELKPVTFEAAGDLPDLDQQMHGVVKEIERIVGQLQQREREVLRAEQLAAAVGQVAAGVAHELRNPLTSVKMLVQTGLEGDAPAGLPPDDLKIIEAEVRRMEQCIRLFIDFARPPRSERRRTDLVTVVRRALALVEGRIRRQNVDVDADLPAAPVFLLIDPEQVHQVLINLLINALEALPRGGSLSVTLAPVATLAEGADGWHESATPEAAAVEVRVRDSGPGIPPKICERLFEPFVSSKESGLGLGLSICKRLIEAHGGSIRGGNAPEGGAVFAFTLPLEVEEAHAHAAGRG